MSKKAGRPRTIESPEEFDRLVDEYKAECRADGRAMTFSGLALHMGFADRRSLYDYADYDGFSHSAKRARLLIESEYEARLSENACTGAIFALKNHGWSDKQELEHTGPDGGPLQVSEVVVRKADG